METPSKSKGHRLLYRGSLSLPDSHLLLDGLSFTVKTNDASASPALLNNTLALTLESLRGLPLHLISTVKVKDTWIDSPDAIYIDIHPEATLTRLYFENLLCLAPITASDGRTEYGVRVSLTDSNDEETPDVLIYGELRESLPTTSADPVASTSSSAPKVLHLLAARILPGPPPPSTFRLPRPDDPTPRRPPLVFGAKRKRDTTGIPFNLNGKPEEGSKRTKTDAKGKGRANASMMDEEAMKQAAADVMRRLPKPQASIGQVNIKSLGKEARVGTKKDVFKVPSVPIRRSTSESESDVFGGPAVSPAGEVGNAGIEKENKTAVKKVVTKMLAEHGVERVHPEFKELFQMCYHGTSFSLRRRMTIGVLDVGIINHFVDAHIKLYVCDALT